MHKITLVGADNAIGQELLKMLSDRSFPFSQLRLLGKNPGTTVFYNCKKQKCHEILVEELSQENLLDSDFVIFIDGSELVEEFLPMIKDKVKILDFTHYCCNLEDIPSIIGGLNDEEYKGKTIFSMPHSTSVILSWVLSAVNSLSDIKRVIISSYQSVSGAGELGIEELEMQNLQISHGKEALTHFFPKQIAYNVLPEISPFEDELWTKEELAVEKEINEILKTNFPISMTAVQVPVLRGYSYSLTFETESELSLEQLKVKFEENGITVFPDYDYPTPWELENTIELGLGRLRKDRRIPNCYHCWVVADNIYLGKILNAIQTLENLV